MGTEAFANFLTSIRDHRDNLNTMVGILEKWIRASKAKLERGSSNAEQTAGDVERYQRELSKTQTEIKELEKFFMQMKKQWMKPEDRVIGHVIWAPPVGVSTTTHGYTKDVCVIELDKRKFSQNFRGNVLDLGAC